MTEKGQVYKCEVCGNIVEVLHAGGGQLVCCGKLMTFKKENTIDASKEKHVPVLEKKDNGILVKVGSVEHPMTKEHYIEWIELNVDDMVYKKFLSPDDKPEAFFNVEGNVISAREYCNLHGLWRTEK